MLARHIAWIIKLKHNWLQRKRNAKQDNLMLTPADIEKSVQNICKIVQNELFPSTINLLTNKQQLPSNDPLLPLRPVILNKLLCVGGRLKNANIPTKSTHQIILSAKHHASKLILSDIHRENFHTGREHTLSLSRQKYWIIRGKNLSRQIIKECFICKKQNAKPQPCLMGRLTKRETSIKRASI